MRTPRRAYKADVTAARRYCSRDESRRRADRGHYPLAGERLCPAPSSHISEPLSKKDGCAEPKARSDRKQTEQLATGEGATATKPGARLEETCDSGWRGTAVFCSRNGSAHQIPNISRPSPPSRAAATAKRLGGARKTHPKQITAA